MNYIWILMILFCMRGENSFCCNHASDCNHHTAKKCSKPKKKKCDCNCEKPIKNDCCEKNGFGCVKPVEKDCGCDKPKEKDCGCDRPKKDECGCIQPREMAYDYDREKEWDCDDMRNKVRGFSERMNDRNAGYDYDYGKNESFDCSYEEATIEQG